MTSGEYDPTRYPQGGPQYPQGGSQYPQGGPQYTHGGGQFPQGGPQYPHAGSQYSEAGPRYPDGSGSHVSSYPQGFPDTSQFRNTGLGAQPANVWIRLGAKVIDLVILIAVLCVLAWVLPLYLYFVVAGIGYFAYFIITETVLGWTVGKKILGLAVRGPAGATRPDPKAAFIRNAWILLSIIPFIGWVLQLIAMVAIGMTIDSSPTHQGKHDELAGGTQVVKTS